VRPPCSKAEEGGRGAAQLAPCIPRVFLFGLGGSRGQCVCACVWRLCVLGTVCVLGIVCVRQVCVRWEIVCYRGCVVC
jgi:hypothetical protein